MSIPIFNFFFLPGDAIRSPGDFCSSRRCRKNSQSNLRSYLWNFPLLRSWFPNISLGTVYRNLNLLTDIGEAIKISTPDGGDRFDGTVQPHNHFLCTKCGRLLDLELDMKSIEEMNRLANDCFDGMITSSSTLFYGECSDCIRKS